MGTNYILTFRDAEAADAELLTQMANASKKHWGYSGELMRQWQDDLQVSSIYIRSQCVVKAMQAGDCVGFYGILFPGKAMPEIDHFWVTPSRIGTGIGKRMFTHAVGSLKSRGYHHARLVADPHAKGFYERMGGVVVEQVPSKLNNRLLDVFEFVF